jgi:hypothetical protein
MNRPVTKSHLEENLEAFFHKRVRLLGGHTSKLLPLVESGIPDRLVLFPGGGLYLVELKADDGALRPDQISWHSMAAGIGVQVVTLTGKDEVVEWLRTTSEINAKAVKAAERRMAAARRRAAAKLEKDLL